MNINEIEVFDQKPSNLDWSLQAINVEDAWEKTKGKGVKIVTIDTGANIEHPDIKPHVKTVFNMILRNRDVTDNYGHGTHVAGLLTSVAPEAELHVLKVLNGDGLGTVSNVMDGITHAMNIKADVLNISLGMRNDIPLILKQRIIHAYESGLTIVCATGNKGLGEAFYPARMEQVIAVGGANYFGKVTEFTNGGYDVIAPSVKVLSTYNEFPYARMTGTSMASPLVAGGIALLIAYNRSKGIDLAPLQIKNIIKEVGYFDLAKLIG